jgi:hypothetical protein
MFIIKQKSPNGRINIHLADSVHRPGKTLIGGLAIERANRSLMFTRHSFISPDAYNWEDQSNRRLILPVASHSGLNYILSRHMKFSGRE